MRWLFMVITYSGLLIVDRWLKNIALNGVTGEFGAAQFILLKNDALVFSWPASNFVAIILMVVAMMIVGVVVWRAVRRGNRLIAYGGILLFIGALSNVYDRFAYGFVIDWAYLGRWWPVFNIADLMIGIGVLWMLWRQSPPLTKRP